MVTYAKVAELTPNETMDTPSPLLHWWLACWDIPTSKGDIIGVPLHLPWRIMAGEGLKPGEWLTGWMNGWLRVRMNGWSMVGLLVTWLMIGLVNDDHRTLVLNGSVITRR